MVMHMKYNMNKGTNGRTHVPVRNVNLVLYCVTEVSGRTRSSSAALTLLDVLVVDGPLTFLDLLMMQDGVIHMIMLHVHVAHPCLCMSDLSVLKHSSSNFARARKVFRAQTHTS